MMGAWHPDIRLPLPKKNAAGFAFLRDFVEEAKRSGVVASLIERHGVTGRLSVAPPG